MFPRTLPALVAVFIGLALASSALAQVPDPQDADALANARADLERPQEGAPSGAVALAPANNSFRDESAGSIKESFLTPSDNAVTPPDWVLDAGKSRVVREDAVRQEPEAVLANEDRQFASLYDAGTTITSSAFTLPSAAPSPSAPDAGDRPVRFNFSYKFTGDARAAHELRVIVLSGPDFAIMEDVRVEACTCTKDWEEVLVDVSKWAGQTVKVRFVSGSDPAARIGVDDVATNLLALKNSRLRGTAFAGDPVNVTSGNFTLHVTDLAIPGKGVNLEFQRYYNSLSAYQGDLGLGWTHSYSWKLTELTGGDLKVLYPDGKEIIFEKDGSEWLAPAGVYDNAKKNGNGTYELTTKTQIVVNFSTSGRLTSLEDRNGNTTTVTYSGSNLDEVTDASGRTLEFTVTSGRITGIEDPLGRTVAFSYSTTSPKVLETVTDVAGEVTEYGYNNDELMTTWTDQLDHVQATNIYDDDDRVAEQTDAEGGATCFYYGSGDTYTSTNCTGGTLTPSAGQTTVANPRGYETRYSFDSDFRINSTRDQLSGVALFYYNANGDTICAIKPSAKRQSFYYDSQGNVIKQAGHAESSSLYCSILGDDYGNGPDVFKAFTYTSRNDLASITDELGRVTEYEYDSSGNLIQVRRLTSAAGSVVSEVCYTHDSAGLVTEALEVSDLTKTCSQSPAGNKTLYEYDSYGNVVTVVNPRFSGQGSPPETTFTYDLGGRKLTATNELSQTTTWTYNARNQVLTVTDNLDDEVSYSYDAKGNLETTTDALANTTTYNYDGLDRLTSVVDALSNTTSYAYDANGNRTSVTNANSETWTSTYDELDRLVSTTDPLSRTATIEYDEEGVSETTDAEGQVITYHYDIEGREDLRKGGGSSCISSSVTCITRSYDDAGLLEYISRTKGYSNGVAHYYTYDALNRITEVSVSASGTSTREVTYEYDEVGDVVSIDWTNGPGVDYAYDEAHNLIAATVGSNTTEYEYDNAGKLTLTTYPSSSGLTSTRTYDDAGRLTSVVNKHDTTTISSFEYTLNANGQRTEMVDLSGTTGYTYDDINQLTEADYPGAAIDTFTYDDVGNRLTRNSTSYTYDEANQLTDVGSVSYGYNDNGQLTSRDSDSFAWGYLGELTSATIDSATATYTYDGNGLRNSRTFDSATTYYTWSWGSSLPVILYDGDLCYIYGNGRLMATDGAGNVENYYLYDGLGSVANVTDDSGSVLVTYTYDVFGGIRTQSAASDNYWTFTGEQTDEESGFSYLRARYYDPEVGRFLSSDPLGGGYPYAGNNPMSFADPSGLALTVVCDAWSGGTCSAAHYEGTIQEMNNELEVLQDGGYGDTAAAGLLADTVNSGGAPIDDASTAVYVAVDTGGIAGGSIADSVSTAGQSAVVSGAGAEKVKAAGGEGGGGSGCGFLGIGCVLESANNAAEDVVVGTAYLSLGIAAGALAAAASTVMPQLGVACYAAEDPLACTAFFAAGTIVLFTGAQARELIRCAFATYSGGYCEWGPPTPPPPFN